MTMTVDQALAACNAADLIADSFMADGRKREAGLYLRASTTIQAALNARAVKP